MKINIQAALTKGDQTELIKLARSIRPATIISKTTSPIASQFFFFPNDAASDFVPTDAETTQHFSIDSVNRNLPAGPSNAGGIQTRFADLYPTVAGMEGLPAPQHAPLPARFGGPAKPPVATKARLPFGLQKAGATTESSHQDLLRESLKNIVSQILGQSLDTFNPATLKIALLRALKSSPNAAAQLAAVLKLAT